MNESRERLSDHSTMLQLESGPFLAIQLVVGVFDCCSFRVSKAPYVLSGCFIAEVDDRTLNLHSVDSIGCDFWWNAA